MKVYDFLAIGLGPFNLSLACLTHPIEDLDGLFLEQGESFNWHPGLLLEEATLQTPFLSDLVTLADPTSPFSFLNYAKQTGRLYSFYIRERFHLLRREYNQYCRWAAERLPNIRFGARVDRVEYQSGVYQVFAGSRCYQARKLVLGTGTTPFLPEFCRGLAGDILHSAEYLAQKERLQTRRAITIVGSGQSAGEIFYDLLTEIDRYGYELNWITRSERFFPLDYSKLTLEMTSPEYADYFFTLPAAKKDHLAREHRHLYKGIDGELLAGIRDLLYSKKVSHEIRTHLLTNSELLEAEHDVERDRFFLTFHQREKDQRFRHETEALILATGYRYQVPAFLDGIASRLLWDNQGRFDVGRNYSVDRERREVFVQNAELHTHGFITPDLGMGCYRNSVLIRELTGREVYPIETRIAFQEFEATDGKVGFLTETPAGPS